MRIALLSKLAKRIQKIEINPLIWRSFDIASLSAPHSS